MACNNLNENQSHQLLRELISTLICIRLACPYIKGTSEDFPCWKSTECNRTWSIRIWCWRDLQGLLRKSEKKVQGNRTQIYTRLPFSPQRMCTNHAITHNNGDENKHTFDCGTSFPFKGPMAHVAQVRQPSFQWTIAMAVSVLQPLSTSDYSLPSRNIDEYQQEKMSSKLLITSPYASPEHHLDLSSVPETSQQLALALEILRPVTEEYPSQPYSTSFNWQEVVDRLPADFTGNLPQM